MATKDMLLGSGDLYIMEYSGGAIPENTTIEVAGNMIGGIKGGATVSYTPTIYSVSDDMRRMKKSLITAEEATFKTGYLSFDLGEIAKIALGSSLQSSYSGTKSTLSVGGGQTITEYLLRFVHTMGNGKKVRITMIGTPVSGFELAFSPENESVINAEFSAVPMNAQGNLFTIEVEQPA